MSASLPALSRVPERRFAAVAAVLALLPLAACGADGEEPTTVNVLAAASLTDVLEELAATFEAEHDEVEVALSFGSSTDLAEQAADGAPGDVLATADEASMQVAVDAGAAADPVLFARNELVLVAPPGNPAGIAGLADLAGATWVRCADEAPCGRLAAELLADAGVTTEPASLEEDARATLDKVVAGEADAGLVYRSDAVAAGDRVETVEIAGAVTRANPYLVAALDQSEDADLASAFVALVTGDAGRQVLRAAGFEEP